MSNKYENKESVVIARAQGDSGQSKPPPAVRISSEKLKKNSKYVFGALSFAALVTIGINLLGRKQEEAVTPPPPAGYNEQKPLKANKDLKKTIGTDPVEKQRAMEQEQQEAQQALRQGPGNKSIDTDAIGHLPEESEPEQEQYGNSESLMKTEPFDYARYLEQQAGTTLPETPASNKKFITLDATLYAAYAKAYQKTLSSKAGFYQVNTTTYPAGAGKTGATGDDLSEDFWQSQRPDHAQIHYLKVFPAVTVIGLNSDKGDEMIARITSGPLRGYRLYGHAPTGQYKETAYFMFDTMVDAQGKNPQHIQAIAVDPDTRIPAIKGKVKRHLLRNMVFGFGTSFLKAYGETIAATANVGGILPIGSAVVSRTVDSDKLVRGVGISTAADTLQQAGTYRQPTHIQKAWKPIGIIFIPETDTQTAQRENEEPSA